MAVRIVYKRVQLDAVCKSSRSSHNTLSFYIIFIILRLFLTMSTAATASSSTANAWAILGAPRARISTQIAAALTTTIPPNPTINNLPRIVVGTRRYVVEEHLSRRRGRSQSSWICHHSEFSSKLFKARLAPPSGVAGNATQKGLLICLAPLPLLLAKSTYFSMLIQAF